MTGARSDFGEDRMSIYDSRNWEATESTDFDGGNRQLTVTGEVQVSAGNLEPVLNEAVPQGINPAILILELATTTSGEVGTDALAWKIARFETPIEQDLYAQVDIRDYALVDVEKLIS
jgi:hypothetical protein